MTDPRYPQPHYSTPPGAPGFYPPPPRTNILAVLALVFGILGGFLAIPFGHIARSQIRRSGEEGNGLALAGLILGYLWLAATAVVVVGFVVLTRMLVDSSTDAAHAYADYGYSTTAPSVPGTRASAPTTGPATVTRSGPDTLRAQADADSPFVRATLADQWVPLLSSKQPGLVADGVTWTDSEILREHRALRAQHPETRLLWSGDWSTFSEKDWWVTAAGVTFSTPEAANAWCDAKGFDADHCFAKLVSTTHPVDGSTLYRK